MKDNLKNNVETIRELYWYKTDVKHYQLIKSNLVDIYHMPVKILSEDQEFINFIEPEDFASNTLVSDNGSRYDIGTYEKGGCMFIMNPKGRDTSVCLVP
jgi:hypothetical protein